MWRNLMKRCDWCGQEEIYIKYHDEEWGVAVHDDKTHFEYLVLESAQSGLSWLTVLKKRENYRKAYDNFDYEKVALYDECKIDELINNEGIIRNRRKIEASINNAKRFIEIRNEFGSFDEYIWKFVDNNTINNSYNDVSNLPASSELSDIVSKNLKKRGFKFLGSITIYSYMQAVGLINDHMDYCFRKNCFKL